MALQQFHLYKFFLPHPLQYLYLHKAQSILLWNLSLLVITYSLFHLSVSPNVSSLLLIPGWQAYLYVYAFIPHHNLYHTTLHLQFLDDIFNLMVLCLFQTIWPFEHLHSFDVILIILFSYLIFVISNYGNINAYIILLGKKNPLPTLLQSILTELYIQSSYALTVFSRGGQTRFLRHLNFRQISRRFTRSFVNPACLDLNVSHIMYENMTNSNTLGFKIEPHLK